jgi:hypothetical protein
MEVQISVKPPTEKEFKRKAISEKTSPFLLLKNFGCYNYARAKSKDKPRIITRNLFGIGTPNTHHASTLAIRPSPLKNLGSTLVSAGVRSPKPKKRADRIRGRSKKVVPYFRA